MEFSGEMNIYRENELSGDFEGEIRERRNQQEKNQQLYPLSQNRYFTHLMSYAFLGILWSGGRKGLLGPTPNVRGSKNRAF
ncbi:hypothetical protein AAG906_017529 [Vitis piasezkii]